MLGGRPGEESDELRVCAMIELCVTIYTCIKVDIVLHSECMAWHLGLEIP